MSKNDLLDYIREGTDDRIYAIAQLICLDTDVGRVCQTTKIDEFFINKIKNVVAMEDDLKARRAIRKSSIQRKRWASATRKSLKYGVKLRSSGCAGS